MFNDPASGKIKFYITYLLLRERKRNPILFSEGSYIPIYAGGELSESVIAFRREHEGKHLIVITGRFFTGLIDYNSSYDSNIWKDTLIKGLWPMSI